MKHFLKKISAFFFLFALVGSFHCETVLADSHDSPHGHEHEEFAEGSHFTSDVDSEESDAHQEDCEEGEIEMISVQYEKESSAQAMVLPASSFVFKESDLIAENPTRGSPYLSLRTSGTLQTIKTVKIIS